MSYSFDGVGDTMTGTFTSTYADPCTIACFIKVPSYPVSPSVMLNLGNSSSSTDQSYSLRTTGVTDRFDAQARDTLSRQAVVNGFASYGLWVGMIGVFMGDTRRDLYIVNLAATGQNTVATTVGDVLQFVRLGQNLAGGADFTGKIAEAAMWNSVLVGPDIDAYLRQTRRASAINASTLIGYWPLTTNNATQSNQGTDAGGALTVTGAVFDPDHPGLDASATLLGQGYT